MKQEPFEKKHTDFWLAMEQSLEDKTPNAELPEQYRRVCHHLAIARSRHYSAALCNRLNNLVIAGHRALYKQKRPWQQSFFSLLSQDLPTVLNRNARYVWLAMALFFAPLLVTAYACYVSEELILSFLDYEQLKNFESMYDPAGEFQTEQRTAGEDWFMFGFYIKNNISIGFQTFAGGIFAGVGSIFIVLFNGIFIGAVAGHIAQIGYNDTFFPFVIGHGAFELTAIGLAGAAGLRLGFSIINPKSFSRIDALKIAGQEAIIMVYAVIIMLLIAAFLEAFWSSSDVIPNSVKYAVGTVFWVMVTIYFVACTLPRAAHQGLQNES